MRDLMRTEYEVSPEDIDQLIEEPSSKVAQLIESSVIFENTQDRMTVSFPVKGLRERIPEERLNAFFDAVQNELILLMFKFWKRLPEDILDERIY